MRLFLFASLMACFGSASTAQAYQYKMICKDNASGISLKLQDNYGDVVNLNAELTGLPYWKSALNFKMNSLVEAWRFSGAYNGENGTLLLKVFHVDSEASISVSEFDCKGAKIGEACTIREEKIKLSCSSL